MTASNLESERSCAGKHKGCSKLGKKCCYRNVNFLQTFNSALLCQYSSLVVTAFFSCLVGTDDCFYIALFSILKHLLRSHVILHERLAFYSAFFFYYPPKWCTLQLWHSWFHMKLLLSWCKFCVHHTPCHFMQSHIHKVYAWMLKVHWTQYKFVFHKLNCWSMTGSLLWKHGICLAVLHFLL